MSNEQRPQPPAEEALLWMELVEATAMARSLDELAERVLPGVAEVAQAPGAFLYVADARLPAPRFFLQGLQPEEAAKVERLCAEQFDAISRKADERAVAQVAGVVVVSLLQEDETCLGLVGFALQEDVTVRAPERWEKLRALLANTVNRLLERARAERQLAHLNTYLTVSSALSQELGLHELLEIALYSCMEAASAEAASVLLLDDEKENFRFYQAEGPAKPVLMTATFPVGEGLAGTVLESQQAEIINNVYGDPRFYGKIDMESGYLTRNMIVVPLTAGEEHVGVLEVLNKIGGDFKDEELHLLLLIAEEIAFAIRNATVFEYVVDSYCRQRQGETSCRGCKRPLGSWTPCVKYREASI